MTNPSVWTGIEGLLLDAVGTVIQPVAPVAEIYQAVAFRQGVPLDRGELAMRFRRAFRQDETLEAEGALVTDESRESLRWRRIVANVMPELPDPEAAFTELWTQFGRSSAWRCFEDVKPALRALAAAGIPVRIASNFDSRLRQVVSGLPELSDYRESLVISSEVGRRKPHRDFYRAACTNLGIIPARVLCVGDDFENDVLAPRRAGLRAVLLDRKGRHAQVSPRVTDLSELVDVLESP